MYFGTCWSPETHKQWDWIKKLVKPVDAVVTGGAP